MNANVISVILGWVLGNLSIAIMGFFKRRRDLNRVRKCLCDILIHYSITEALHNNSVVETSVGHLGLEDENWRIKLPTISPHLPDGFDSNVEFDLELSDFLMRIKETHNILLQYYRSMEIMLKENMPIPERAKLIYANFFIVNRTCIKKAIIHIGKSPYKPVDKIILYIRKLRHKEVKIEGDDIDEITNMKNKLFPN